MGAVCDSAKSNLPSKEIKTNSTDLFFLIYVMIQILIFKKVLWQTAAYTETLKASPTGVSVFVQGWLKCHVISADSEFAYAWSMKSCSTEIESERFAPPWASTVSSTSSPLKGTDHCWPPRQNRSPVAVVTKSAVGLLVLSLSGSDAEIWTSKKWPTKVLHFQLVCESR